MSVGGIGLVLLLIVSAVAAWGVRRGLEPLRELAAQAGTISVLNWEFQPPAEASLAKELAPLTGAIETVLERLQESFRQQRDFTSDAAHELKTSVAIVKSTLQSLLQRPRPESEYRAGLEGLLEDCGRLEDLLGSLLRLARIEQGPENGVTRELGVTEITSTCEAAVSRIQSLAEARNIHIELVAPQEIHLQGDPEDLEVIWVNLLENAVQYSPAGSNVVIHVERESSGTGMRFGARFGTGHSRGTTAACVSAILPGRSFAVPVNRRIRAGAGDLQSHCDGVWRADRGH